VDDFLNIDLKVNKNYHIENKIKSPNITNTTQNSHHTPSVSFDWTS